MNDADGSAVSTVPVDSHESTEPVVQYHDSVLVDDLREAERAAHDAVTLGSQWAGLKNGKRWNPQMRKVAGARAVEEIDIAIRQLTAVRERLAPAVGGPWYPTPTNHTIDNLAEAIANFHVTRLPAEFDESVAAVFAEQGTGFSWDELATAIMHARELLTDNSIMTFTTSSGPCAPINGGTFETRDHDIATATRLVGSEA